MLLRTSAFECVDLDVVVRDEIESKDQDNLLEDQGGAFPGIEQTTVLQIHGIIEILVCQPCTLLTPPSLRCSFWNTAVTSA
jgi:hypothetical protein